MSAFAIAMWIAFGVSAVVGERFYRRLPKHVGEFVDSRVVFRASSDRATERWRRYFLLSLAGVMLFGLASIVEAWPR